MTLLRVNRAPAADGSPFESAAAEREMLNERSFKNMIAIERKRTERSREPFLMMLLEAGIPEGSEVNAKALEAIAGALLSRSRETDLVGWYSDAADRGRHFYGSRKRRQKRDCEHHPDQGEDDPSR